MTSFWRKLTQGFSSSRRSERRENKQPTFDQGKIIRDEIEHCKADERCPCDRLLQLLSEDRGRSFFLNGPMQNAFSLLVQRRDLRVVPLLIDALSDTEGRSFNRIMGYEAQRWLLQLVPDNLANLRSTLQDRDEQVRLWVAMTLGSIPDKDALPSLLQGLENELEMCRSEVQEPGRTGRGWAVFGFAWALSELVAPDAIPLLTRLWQLGIQVQRSRSSGHTMTLYNEREDDSAFFLAKIILRSSDSLRDQSVIDRFPDELGSIVADYVTRLESDPKFRPSDVKTLESIWGIGG